MSEEKRLTVAFGEFSCEVVGFDDPYEIVAQVVDLFKDYSLREGKLTGQPVDLDALKSAAMANEFAQDAARVDVKGENDGARLIVTANTVAEAVHENTVEEHPFPVEAMAEEAPLAEALTEVFAENDTPSNNEDTTEATAPVEPVAEEPSSKEPEAPATPTKRVQTGYSMSLPSFDEPEVVTAADVVSEDNENVLFDDLEIEEEPATEQVANLAEEPAPAVAEATDDVTEDAPEPLNEDDLIIRRAQRAITDFEDIYDEVPEAPAASEPAEFAEEPAEPAAKPAARSSRVVKELSSTLRRIDQLAAKPAKAPKSPRVKMEMSVSPKRVEKPTASHPANHDELKKRIKNEPAEDAFAGNFLFDDVAEEDTTTVESTKAPAQISIVSPVEHVEPLLLTDPIAKPAPVEPPLTLSNPIEPAQQPAAVELPKLAVQSQPEPAPIPSAPVETAKPALAKVEEPKTAKKTKSSTEGGFGRLEEARDAALPKLNEFVEPKAPISEPRLVALTNEGEIDDSISAEEFAQQVGATSLQGLLEATAVYMAIVQGKNSFSRREVMQAFSLIGTDREYTQEARLKTFRKLLTTGALVRMDDGEFSISHATRYGYENQLRA
ncbi:MAG: hypothetical protein ACPGGK_07895 [Pikeienuella sp.]